MLISTKDKKNSLKTNYSVDMIKLKTKISPEEYQYIYNKLLYFNPNVKQWTSSKYGANFYNLQIKQQYEKIKDNGEIVLQEYSYYVGYDNNSENITRGKKSLVIEYNPNKCPIDGILKTLLCTWFNEEYKIVNADLTCDILDINIMDCILDKGLKHNVKEFKYGKNNKTFYIGERKEGGQVKVYNKAIEENSQGEKTRYEINVKVGMSNKIISNYQILNDIPILYYNNPQQSIDLELNATDKAILYAVKNGYDINLLSRDKKDKIKKALNTDKCIEVSKLELEMSLINYIINLDKSIKKYNSSMFEVALSEIEVINTEKVEGKKNLIIKEKNVKKEKNNKNEKNGQPSNKQVKLSI